MITKINTERAPKAIGPYSQAIEVGNFVFVSGQIPVDPITGLIQPTIESAATQSLENLKAILDKAGLTLEDVVKTTIFLSDMSNFAAVNEVYGKYFKEPYPARSCVAVKELPKNVLVEIEAIAIKK